MTWFDAFLMALCGWMLRSALTPGWQGRPYWIAGIVVVLLVWSNRRREA